MVGSRRQSLPATNFTTNSYLTLVNPPELYLDLSNASTALPPIIINHNSCIGSALFLIQQFLVQRWNLQSVDYFSRSIDEKCERFWARSAAPR